MEIVQTVAELRTLLDNERSSGKSIGFAPTMGALHAGHASLIEAAADRDDVAVTSIFVNPLQFAPGEDLDAYPRTFEVDCELAQASGASVIFAPSVDEMYPDPLATAVNVGGITARWEGESRPDHFDGVATVVTKLASIVGRSHGYFGEKDFQQLAMIRRLVSDLSLPMSVVGMPTVREADGLAMSSRNRRLTTEQRAQAPTINRALRFGAAAIEAGETSPSVIEDVVRIELENADLAASPDYVAVVDPDSLEVPDVLDGSVRLLTAVRFGDVRLIDNLGAETVRSGN